MTYLDELTPRTKYYSVKVRVVTKNRAIQPVGKSRYQRLTIKDEKGTYMGATLFDEDIDMFNDIIQKDGDYEISNASISRVNAFYADHCNDHQMTISSCTLVRRLDSGASSSQTVSPYRQLSSIPHDAYAKDHFDLMAIVLYIEPPKSMPGAVGFPMNVRSVIVTDDSVEHTLVVSLWSDLADTEAMKLASVMENSPIIGFSDLQPSKHVGFSLASSRSTLITFDPVGERAEALQKWKEANVDVVNARKLQVVDAHALNAIPASSTIKEILSKFPNNVVYEMNIRVNVLIPDFKKENVTVFFGCKMCGKKAAAGKNISFVCDFCGRASTTEPRIFFNFQGTDGTATKLFSAYTKVAEKMFAVRAEDLLDISFKESADFYGALAARFSTTPTCIELSPVPPPHPRIHTIKWIMKDVVFE